MHRSSIVAKATTGRVGITPDDKKFILEPLTRYGFLPTDHIVGFDTRHFTTTRSRLKRFFHETENWRYADKSVVRHIEALRFSVNVQAQYRRGPAVYETLNIDAETKRWLEATVIGPHFNDHDVALSTCIAEIEQSVKRAGLRFIDHIEILRHASEKAQRSENPFHIPVENIGWNFKGGRQTIPKTEVRPDALFGIEYETGVRFFAAERDKGNETYLPDSFYGTSWLKKYLSYHAIKPTLQEYLGIPKLYVLAIMQTPQRADNLLAKTKLVYPSGTDIIAIGHSKPVGAFSRIPSPDDTYFEAEWKRVGHPPLNLARI